MFDSTMQKKSSDTRNRSTSTRVRFIAAAAAAAAAAMLFGAGVSSAGVPDPSGLYTQWPMLTSVAANPAGPGYWMQRDAVIDAPTSGITQTVGGAPNLGSVHTSGAFVRATPDGKGYYVIDADGEISARGDAVNFGTLGAHTGWRPQPGPQSGNFNPISGFAVTPSGQGLWVIDSLGNVWTVGDAKDYGDAASKLGDADAVDIVATHDGLGYTIVASDGGVFTYGDAIYSGHTGASDVTAITPTRDDHGYWILERDGTVLPYGDAVDYGSPKPLSGKDQYVYTDIAAMPDGNGYYVVDYSGNVTAIGGTPTANPSTYYSTVGVPAAIELTGTSNNPISKYTVTSEPTQGTLSGFNPTTGDATYTPNSPYWEGTDSFAFTVTNATGTSAPATITINVFDPCSRHLCTTAHPHDTQHLEPINSKKLLRTTTPVSARPVLQTRLNDQPV